MLIEQLMHMNDGAMSPTSRTTNPINNNQLSSSFDRTSPANIIVNKISTSPHQSRLMSLGSANMLGVFDMNRGRGLSSNELSNKPLSKNIGAGKLNIGMLSPVNQFSSHLIGKQTSFNFKDQRNEDDLSSAQDGLIAVSQADYLISDNKFMKRSLSHFGSPK